MSLNGLAKDIHNISRAKGFWPNGAERNPGEVLMLIVTEVAEAMEDIRDGKPLNELLYAKSGGKLTGVPSEMADIIIRVLDACAAWGIDIDDAVRRKINYNLGRPTLHGRAL